MANPKLHHMGEHSPGQEWYAWHCPGCECAHYVTVPRWTWNGSMERPTFHPSVLVNQHDPASRCHSWVKDGRMQFLAGCYHQLAGQTVEIPDWDN